MDATFRVDDGSRRHHYIAEFYSKGFVNSQGLLYVYDKKADRYQRPRSPKQLFYEDEGNTAYWGEVRNTVAEQGFKYLDDLTAEHVAVLRTKDRDTLKEEDTGFMMYLMAIQFLRCPSNFVTYRNLFENIDTWAPELFNDYPLLKHFPKDETLMKSSRSFIPGYIINRLARDTPGPYPMSILEHYTEDFLVLTDNPVVYVPPPMKMAGLFTNNMLAVSSRRLCVSGDLKSLGTDILQMQGYNVLAVAQADRLVCASSKMALRNAVEAWKFLLTSRQEAGATRSAREPVRSDAGGYWKGIASTMNTVYDHLSTDLGWHEEDAILRAIDEHPERLKAALDTLVNAGKVSRKMDGSGANYRTI
jgi:hypothetical protein